MGESKTMVSGKPALTTFYMVLEEYSYKSKTTGLSVVQLEAVVTEKQVTFSSVRSSALFYRRRFDKRHLPNLLQLTD